MHRRLTLVSAALFLPMLVACVVEQDGGNDPNPKPHGYPTAPMTVSVDTGQTMTAAGGQGVGVFVQYSAGGHWHVWWTCDTSLSGLGCDFDINMQGTAIANAKSTQFESNDVLDTTNAPTELVAVTHTTTGVDAVDFDATPGADMQVEVTVSGLHNGTFFFFVEDGKINGGYTGTLSDPLVFEPNTP